MPSYYCCRNIKLIEYYKFEIIYFVVDYEKYKVLNLDSSTPRPGTYDNLPDLTERGLDSPDLTKRGDLDESKS